MRVIVLRQLSLVRWSRGVSRLLCGRWGRSERGGAGPGGADGGGRRLAGNSATCRNQQVRQAEDQR